MGWGRFSNLVMVVGVGFATPAAAQQQRQDTTTADSARIRLAPIEVSVTRGTAAATRAAQGVSVVTADVIRSGRPTLGLDESLVRVPGVFVSNRYNPSLDQRVSIRGFGSRSAFGARGVKILLDGIPQTLPDGQGQLNNIDPATVGRIEVLRGSASSLYGNASGGVIDVRTEAPPPGRATARARAVGAAYETWKWLGGVSAPVGSGTISLNGSRTQSNGYRQHSEAAQQQFGLRLEQFAGEATRVLFSAHFSDAPTLENPGSLTREEVMENPAQAAPNNLSANAGKAVSQGQAGLTVTHRVSDRAAIDIVGFGLYRDLDNPLSFAYIELDRTAWGGRVVTTLSGPASAVQPRFVFGLDVQRQRDDRLNFTPDHAEVTLDQLERVMEVGPFAHLTVNVGRAALSTGIRYDRVSFDAEDRFLFDGDESGTRVMSAWSGSVGGSIDIGRVSQPYASVSTAFETPTTTELVNRPTGAGGFNPELNPQRAITFEVGARGTLGAWGSYGLGAFHTAVRDALIPFEVPGAPGRQFFRNAGSARHRGIETQLTLHPAPWATFVSSYTYGDYTFRDFQTEDGSFDGNRIPGVPEHHLYTSGQITSSRGLWVALDNRTASGMFADDANEAEVDGWSIFDVRVGWDGTVGGWSIEPFGGIRNLFNERYIESAVVNAGFGRFFEPAPPRNAYVGLGIGIR